MSSREPDHTQAPHGAAQRRNKISRDPAIDRFLRSRNDLSERQRTAVELLLRGMTDQEVAVQLGVDRGTVLCWRSKSIAFQRELDRQRRALWERSAGKIQAMVDPALAILHKQLTSDDEKIALRAAAVLLRFATPSRLAGLTAAAPPRGEPNSSKQYVDDLIAYVEAPLPGQPGAPEDMVEELDDQDFDEEGEEEDEPQIGTDEHG